MNDMLDFSAIFWEDILDNLAPNVDDSNILIGGLTYAAGDYLGDGDSVVWMQEFQRAKREWLRFSQADPAKQRSENLKLYPIKNRSS